MLRVETLDGNGDHVDFVAAGTSVKGEYHCADCSYGVTVHDELPVCPMCAGTAWEQTGWSPLRRATTAAAQ